MCLYGRRTCFKQYMARSHYSYDGVIRFKASTAAHMELVNDKTTLGASKGLVQAICDNFDANISCQNGTKCTCGQLYCLHKVSQLQQRLKCEEENKGSVKWTADFSGINNSSSHVQKPEETCRGPSSIIQPHNIATEILKRQNMSLRRANNCLKSITELESTPQFAGFSRKYACKYGYEVKPWSKTVYRSLVNIAHWSNITIMLLLFAYICGSFLNISHWSICSQNFLSVW